MQSSSPKSSKKKLLDPSTNVLQISSKADLRQTAFRVKIYLKKYQEVELQALGEAISQAVSVAESLQRAGLIKMKKIQQSAYYVDNGDTNGDRQRRKLKLTLVCERTEACLDRIKDIK